MKITQFLTSLGIDISLMIAGMVGSLLMISKESAFNMRTTLIGVVSGTMAANYLTPIVIDFLSLEGKSQFGIAFLLGYFGLKGVELVTKKIMKQNNIEE
jgi:hypothetical protein